MHQPQTQVLNWHQCENTLPSHYCILRELGLLWNGFQLVLEEARKHKSIFFKRLFEYSVYSCYLNQVGKSGETVYDLLTGFVVANTLENLRECFHPLFRPAQLVIMENIPKYSLKAITGKEKCFTMKTKLKKVKKTVDVYAT